MGVTIKEFVQAIAEKLMALYPDYDVYSDEIKQGGYENCFFVGVIEAQSIPQQPLHYRRHYDFDLQFFPVDDSKASFFDWSEVMMQEFDELEVGDDSYWTRDFSVAENDRIFHCFFSVEFYVKEREQKDYFEELDIKEEVKNGHRKRKTGGSE